MNTQIIRAVSATEIGDYKIRIGFDDGTMQEIDFMPFLASALHPDIRVYLDPQLFSTFRIEYGDLVWGDYDMCFPIIDLYKNQLAERFLATVSRDKFDYTEWRRTGLPQLSIEEIAAASNKLASTPL